MDADEAALYAMVQRASVRNEVVGITGMLWSDGAHFAQVLEGEHNCVSQTRERIAADTRHADISVVLDHEVRSRAFGDWGMIQPDNEPESIASTAFLVGLSMSQCSQHAKRLHDIVIACEA